MSELKKHSVSIENAEKIYFPDCNLTKGDVAEYYEKVAKHILPHLRNRPISMEQFPNGIGEEGFFQKEVPDYFPDWIERVNIKLKEQGSSQEQVVVNNEETLLYLINQGMITPHVWLSLCDKIEKPDRIIFDLDPPESMGFDEVISAAKDIKKLFEEDTLTSFVMTTGGSGLHVVLPIERQKSFEETREWIKVRLSKLLEDNPEKYTDTMRKDKRKGKLFLDYLRNAYGQTTVAPYALRAKEGAPIATPLDWEELTGIKSSKEYTISNIFKRLAQKEDPWKDISSLKQGI